MPQVNLWLVRHGETEVNSGIWSSNPNDTHLTLKGIEQAKRGAAEVVLQPDLIISSPLVRAQETSHFYKERWPHTATLISPIQEFIYLSPQKLSLLRPEVRKRQVHDYWIKSDPFYRDSEETESFAAFLKRVSSFYTDIKGYKGYVIAIGHGQFFKAFLLGLEHGFDVTPDWMRFFRNEESTMPIRNGEIIKLTL